MRKDKKKNVVARTVCVDGYHRIRRISSFMFLNFWSRMQYMSVCLSTCLKADRWVLCMCAL